MSKEKAICKTCGKEFYFLRSTLRGKDAKFCSRKCIKIIPWNKGSKGLKPWMNISGLQTKEAREKARLSKKGIRAWNKGIKGCVNGGSFKKGHPVSEGVRRAVSFAQKGEKSWNWKGGISFLPYTLDWTEELRNDVRKRDYFICRVCFKHGGVVHHIDYDKTNCDSNNLVTLCASCHARTNDERTLWEWYFTDKMYERRGICLQ